MPDNASSLHFLNYPMQTCSAKAKEMLHAALVRQLCHETSSRNKAHAMQFKIINLSFILIQNTSLLVHRMSNSRCH
jgi:hypothetical protein